MNRKNIKKELKKYQGIIILLIISVPVTMYIYGMTEVYLPNPIHIGGGQYFDIATGVIVIALLLSGVIIAILFKKEKKR